MKSYRISLALAVAALISFVVYNLGGYYSEATPAKVAGLYAYRLSTGEVEVLSLFDDMKFRHSLFKDHAAFALGAERTFDENGVWSLDGNGIIMTMSVLFDYNQAYNESRLPVPKLTSGEQGYWLGGNGAMIVRDEDSRYCMERIKEPDDIKEFSFR